MFICFYMLMQFIIHWTVELAFFLVLPIGGPDKSSPVPGRWGILCQHSAPGVPLRTLSGKAISCSWSLPTTSRFLLGHQKHNSMNH